jgi:hypothetical protein
LQQRIETLAMCIYQQQPGREQAEYYLFQILLVPLGNALVFFAKVFPPLLIEPALLYEIV